MPRSPSRPRRPLDPLGLVVEAQDDLVDLGHLRSRSIWYRRNGAIEHRNDGLGGVERERPQPRAFAPGQQDSLHDNPHLTR